MRYRHFLFDLDDTLYAYEEANKIGQKAAIALAVSMLGIEESLVKHAFSQARDQIHNELSGQGSSHHRLLYFKRMLEILGKSFLMADELEKMFWDTFLDSIELRPGALEFLQYVKEQGGKVFIITDLVTDIQFKKLKKLGLTEDLIDGMISSEEAGHEKPHPYMFLRALHVLGATTDDAVVVGDNFKKDIQGALNLGLSTIWLRLDDPEKESLVFVENPKIAQVRNFAEMLEHVR